MSHGVAEQCCLNIIKNYMFPVYKYFPFNPDLKDKFYRMTHDKFVNDIFNWVNNDCHKCYFGLLEDDRLEIPNVIRTAKPNSELSLFPDFIFDDGFIEHFKVTSSKTTSKGSKQEKFGGYTKRLVDKQAKEWADDKIFLVHVLRSGQ